MKRKEALIFRVAWLLISFRQDSDHWRGHRQFHQRGNNVQGHREGVAGVPAETDRGQGGGLCEACRAQLPGGSTHHERTGSVFVSSFSLSLCINYHGGWLNNKQKNHKEYWCSILKLAFLNALWVGGCGCFFNALWMGGCGCFLNALWVGGCGLFFVFLGGGGGSRMKC